MFNKRKKQCAGQSTVEYIVLVTAVLAVAIAFMTNSGGPFQSRLNTTLGTVTDQMSNMADRLTPSHAPTNGSSGSPAVMTDPTANLLP